MILTPVLAALLCVPVAAEPPPVADLVRQLKDPEARTRRLAAEALGRQKAAAAVADLAALLGDADAGVRTTAAGALVRIGPDAVPALGPVLTGESDPAREAALTALVRIGPGARAATEPLVTVLKGKNTRHRIRAAEVLAAIGPGAKAALPALFEAARDTANLGPSLGTGPGNVAEAAIAAALKIDPECPPALSKAALPDLTAALKGKDNTTLQAAGSAIRLLGPHAKPALPALEEARARAKGFAEHTIRGAIVAAGGDVTGPLAATIRDASAPLDKRLAAIRDLQYGQAGTGPTVVAVLVETLKDSEPKIRAGAVDALSSLGADAAAAAPALLGLLGDEELERAADAVPGAMHPLVPHALARLGKAAVPGLADVLGDAKRPVLVRYHAVLALGKIGAGARAARPALEGTLGDRYAIVALEAAGAYALAGGDPAKATPVIRQGLRHDVPFLAVTSARAAERLGTRGKGLVDDLTALLGHKDAEVRIAAAHALSAIGPAAKGTVPAMAKLLRSEDRRERYQVATALAKFGPDAAPAAKALVEYLGEKDVGRSSPDPGITLVGAIGPDAAAAVPALLDLLKRSRGFGEEDVLAALGAIGPGAKAAVPQLVTYLGDRNSHTRAAAARGLGGIGPGAKEAVPALTKMLGDESTHARAWAAYALARIEGDAKSRVAVLVELWEDDRGESSFNSAQYDLAQCLELLGADARPARDALLECVTAERTPAGTRLIAARALGALVADADAIVPKLVEALRTKAKGYDRVGSIQAAAEALGRLGTKARAAVPELRKLLDDDTTDVVAAARRALERIQPE